MPLPLAALAVMAGSQIGKGLWGYFHDPTKKAKNELEKYYDLTRARATRDVMSQLSRNTRALSARMAAQGMATSGAGIFQPALQAQAFGGLADMNSRLGIAQAQQMAQLAQMRGQQQHQAIGDIFDTGMNAGEMMLSSKLFPGGGNRGMSSPSFMQPQGNDFGLYNRWGQSPYGLAQYGYAGFERPWRAVR